MRTTWRIYGCAGLALAAVMASCGQEAPLPEPVRVRLFDLMDRATQTQGGGDEADGLASPARTWSYDFDESTPDTHWFARVEGRRLVWGAEGATVVSTGGVEGGSLQLGPGVEL